MTDVPRTSVCFVCLGNICRSPTAAAVMRQLIHEAGLADRITVESAGTADWHEGKGADPRTLEAATRSGIPMDHVARQFRPADFERFDLIVAMDGDNVEGLRAIAPDGATADRIRLLRSFDPEAPHGAHVPDPYYGGPEGFEDVIAMCRRACEGLLDHIRGGS